MERLVTSTNLRVWGSKNATASELLVVNSFLVPLWKPTELQVTLIDNHNIDSILFEVLDQSSFVSKLFISPEMSVAILSESTLTAGQLKRAAPVSSLRPSYRSFIKDNTASAMLIPDFKDKETSSKPRFLSVSLTRGASVVSAFAIEYRVYSKHSGTRSALLLNPAQGTGAYRASKKEQTVKKASSSSKTARTTTKKTTTPLSAISNNTVRTKMTSQKKFMTATPSSDQENFEMASSCFEAEHFSSPFNFYPTSLSTSPLNYEDVLTVADVLYSDDSYSSSPSSETDTETYSSDSNSADEEFARNVMAGPNADIFVDEFDDRALQDSTPFLAQISV